ncbi:MAG: DUF4861 domain-containing protein [Paludibacteraceae bacterium]
MKLKLFILLIISSGIMSSVANLKVGIYNPNNTNVKDYPVVLSLNNYKKIPINKRAEIAVFVHGKQVSTQLDDLDKDGIADELVFLLDLNAGQTQKVILRTIHKHKQDSFPTEVYADLISKTKDGKLEYVHVISSTKNDMYNKLHHHGVAFESALIGYRMYFDNKSTIDLYGKKKQQLELAETGWYPTDEQLASGYGDDVLTVYNSVGVGTVRGWDGVKAINIDKFDRRTQRIVATGKLRTIVESEVSGWQYEGKKIDMTVRYILYARHRDAVCEVRASENITNLASGVLILKNGQIMDENGLVGSWGTDYPVSDTIKYSKQTCGLGVYVPKQYVNKLVREGLNNLVLMNYHKGEVLRFYLTAVAKKEEWSSFKSSEQFFDYLKTWSEVKPVEIE